MRHERIHRADIEAQLARALAASAHDSGVVATVDHRRSRAWASATFVGARHEVVVAAAPSAALDAWLATLPDAEFALRGHVVASLDVDDRDEAGADVRVTLAVLTIEDG